MSSERPSFTWYSMFVGVGEALLAALDAALGQVDDHELVAQVLEVLGPAAVARAISRIVPVGHERVDARQQRAVPQRGRAAPPGGPLVARRGPVPARPPRRTDSALRPPSVAGQHTRPRRVTIPTRPAADAMDTRPSHPAGAAGAQRLDALRGRPADGHPSRHAVAPLRAPHPDAAGAAGGARGGPARPARRAGAGLRLRRRALPALLPGRGGVRRGGPAGQPGTPRSS